MEQRKIILFEGKKIRRYWDDKLEKWYFSVVDVIAVLTDSVSPFAYWRKLKQRLKEEGSETVTKCHGLKMLAADGKMRFTDTADTEVLLRIIQSIPSSKAEPFKLWLARVGYLTAVEEPTEYTIKALNESRKNKQNGNIISFKNNNEVLEYIDSLIAHDKKSHTS